MTSAEIRQSFLHFFREKQHTIVPSSSLLPDSPNLLFTNAGMNQFVPIFLGQQTAPYQPPRAADTQKCIRAGGKHNDLDDVGLDTYHHTFFEMLGNWSFGDYFKKEAIDWAWELVVERWGLPPQRLYATVYKPGDGEPSEFDQEAHDHWARLFMKAGLDPAVQIVNGNKKDNFWMMGDTGPCGPCSELHVDLTPNGDTRGSLVNAGDPRCIEIWNLVFIQFNANPDGTFVPLPQRHVDTGMGFERACSIIQGTKGFSDFTGTISNYETDVFRPIFDEIERLSGKSYASTLPVSQNMAGSGPPASTSASDVSSSSPGVSTRPSGVSTSSSAVFSWPSVGGGEPSRDDGEPSRDDGELSRDAEGSVTAPAAASAAQIAIDIAFRVIADHIRTLSFAIADGIQPGNTDRNYVLRRILRRAVRYSRTLGFHEPFFFKLVDVVTATMGNVFPELRAKQQLIRDTLRREEDSFNRTLDKGIALFDAEVNRISGRAGVPPAGEGVPPERTSGLTEGATYTRRRRLPHFEQPWAIYALTISTAGRRKLRPESRTIVLNALRHFDHARYDLIAACVMPDHLHVLIRPWVKEQNERGEAVFWSLSELTHSVKSFTAKEINKTEGTTGSLWEQERFDRYVRGDRDLEEKFQYIISNPEREGLGRDYPWVWTQEDRFGKMPKPAGETPTLPGTGVISGAFAFRLYDEQGFPLDLTELMARERGLTVDVAGFEQLMEQQRSRARAAQKKETITLSDADALGGTTFVGYEMAEATARVVDAVALKDGVGVVLDTTACYAEMGGQVGDTGELTHNGTSWRIANTQKAGSAVVHVLASGEPPVSGAEVSVRVDVPRRRAIERHHTVTHLLHWALHEVVSREAAQKGSYVGPEKLTFDFNNAALTPEQLREVEKLVNERIVENSAVSWIEMPYQEVKMRPEIMQFFGDKYGDTVRVVQIGGEARALNGYSMELCGGTHVRGTGEIGLFRIVGESAIAAGVRRIEAVAGLNAYDQAKYDQEFIRSIAGKLNSPVNDLEKRIESMLAQQKVLEKSIKALEQKQAVETARELVGKAQTIGDIPAIIANLGAATGDQLQAIAEALKQQRFSGVAVLAGVVDGTVALVATVGSEFTAKVQAGKIIQSIAPLIGGKGGGRPDGARGAGKDGSKLDAALAHARSMLAS